MNYKTINTPFFWADGRVEWREVPGNSPSIWAVPVLDEPIDWNWTTATGSIDDLPSYRQVNFELSTAICDLNEERIVVREYFEDRKQPVTTWDLRYYFMLGFTKSSPRTQASDMVPGLMSTWKSYQSVTAFNHMERVARILLSMGEARGVLKKIPIVVHELGRFKVENVYERIG